MRKKPNYTIEATTVSQVTIRDVGPWHVFPTVTNGAEDVVHDLMMRGLLRNGVKLLYYDSEGNLDQLMHWNGLFKGYTTAKTKPFKEDPKR